ncbi:prolyl oligopeptidase family serine peptidase, partial [Zeaxanthinibacter enoshimensis]|uniref:prolyl oligopeptidase family serine peptidase n=1 Tax=Zeaxanthinibacter enoshimensis TaxID=392009 RepID=UPI003564BAC1
MRNFLQLFTFLFCIATIAQQVVTPAVLPEKTVSDTYHGTVVKDPYRYVENLEDPTVLSWMRDHSNYARTQLDAIPGRKSLLDKFFEFDSRVSSNVSTTRITENGRYFYIKFRPEDDNGKLYYRDRYQGEEKLLFDPETYRPDADVNYVINNIFPDKKGDKVAVFVSADGSENSDLFILSKDGTRFPDLIDRCDYWGFSWMPDNDSFTYLRYNSSDLKDVNRQINMKTFLHVMGSDVDQDRIALSADTHPAMEIAPKEIPIFYYDELTRRYFAAPVTVEKNYRLYMSDNQTPGLPENWVKVVKMEDEVVNTRTDGKYLYVKSFKNAPNYKISRLPLDNTNSPAETVVPESKNEVIRDFEVTREGLYYSTTENGVESKVYFIANGQTKAKRLELPFTAGSIALSNVRSDLADIWMEITGWTSPSKRYRYLANTNTFEYEPLSSQAEYPELDQMEIKETTITSHDGTRVPLSIIYKKGLNMNGKNPTLLYGYGSYGATFTPVFSPILLNFVVHDGVFAIAHVRGGGELGDKWHKAGQKTTKPNTWKDAIAAAEYLIAEKYSSKETLGIWGGSAGGILVGRAMTERPDLFSFAIPEVGAMNTVRMEASPNGPVNAPEFGTVEDPDEFRALLEMDSYHHLKEGVSYPATLVTAGFNDPRVIAWEPA